MFEAAELGQILSKKEFEKLEPSLRLELVELQQELRRGSFPVVVLFAGVDGAGKGETVNELNAWLDPRWTMTHAYTERSEEERERPHFWRYWRDLPPKGKIGFFLSAWYSQPLVERVYGQSTDAELDQQLARIATFEKILADDGALILKYWMHLGKAQQKKRLKALERDPLTSWRVSETDWKNFGMYDAFIATTERTILKTSTGQAPWTIIDGEDPRYRVAAIAASLRDGIRKHLASAALASELRARQAAPAPGAKASKTQAKKKRVDEPLKPTTILGAMDLTQALEKKSYEQRYRREQARLGALGREARRRGISTLLVFEGQDAAGKGGAIRRVTAAFDARDFQVIPIAAPNDEERAHHYLWRFWRHLSRAGRLTIFDRSWYGRVLVERVEGFASESEWQRAYAELNHFESRLIDHGIVLVKYWLQVSQEEQLRRFKEREQTPFKRWKLTEEDWRNRDKWGDYELAVNEMVARTSTRVAPWTLVEGNCKRFARVKVLKTLADALETRLEADHKGRGKRKSDKK